MAQAFDGPVTINGALTVKHVPGGAGETGREPIFEVTGTLSRFANIFALAIESPVIRVGGKNVVVDGGSVGSLAPFTLHVGDGGIACKGNIALTAGDVIVRGTSLLAGLQALQGSSSTAALAQRVSALEQKVTAVQNQLNTAVSNLTGRISLMEVAVSDLKFRVTQLGG